ncbi:M15 family metallopeptidase [Spongiactinospora sp. TRM90649]|uniref:M15 family metallopeptidase n=1 Tax=Spongiactinospora sp. TRM90649 TaxID=3031114 RepID=UPI0023F65CD6|nr:M15 family metallopeptidase [Spongiactinospora sp. TRM90649]MDF5753018.1 M15 family metallopeptidase [Spongiactinospora sp. TRM90649]
MPGIRRALPALLVSGCLATISACGDAGNATTPTPAPPSTSPPPTQQPTAVPSPTPTGPPAYTSKVSRISRDQVPYSWRPGCPVPLQDLRMVTLTIWGFDDKPHTGRLVVHKSVTGDIEKVFKRLYDWRFPIKRMEPVDAFKGSDFDSIEANNTSAFNCRPATGSSNWSQHAYGRAIDINPRENPYVTANGSVAHTNARKFARRPINAPGVINPGDRVVRAFAALGWQWGGYWSGTKDYQHFSKGGG